MGAECCNENKGDMSSVPDPVAPASSGSTPAPVAQQASVVKAEVQKDLPAVSMDGKDQYEKFEFSLPFYRTPIKTYEQNIEKANQACGGQGFVTIDALNRVFTSSAWAQLTQDESKLCKVLLSDAFKDEEKGMAPDQIDVTFLMCMGLLHCGGTPKDKAEVFYGVL